MQLAFFDTNVPRKAKRQAEGTVLSTVNPFS